MIYVSTTCVKKRHIKDSVEALALAGFTNVELSGGSNYYYGFEKDLIEMKKKYNLNYRLHNYFPPPEKHFMLNLASSNFEVRNQSMDLCKRALELSSKLGADKYGVHAGFLMDFLPKEAGKKIGLRRLIEKEKGLENFASSWNEIKGLCDDRINLYVENNVFSFTNSKTYFPQNPFLLTCYADYLELIEYIDFRILLDVAHLKVSAKTLKINFENELNRMFDLTDYIHLSNNDGFHDQNHNLKFEKSMLDILSKQDFKNKTFTLETYCEIEKIKDDYKFIDKRINNSLI